MHIKATRDIIKSNSLLKNFLYMIFHYCFVSVFYCVALQKELVSIIFPPLASYMRVFSPVRRSLEETLKFHDLRRETYL